MKKHFSEEKIIGFLREADAGVAVRDLCCRHGFGEASYYLWRRKFGGMSVPDAKRLKELETQNTRLKTLLAEQMFENDVIEDMLRKKATHHDEHTHLRTKSIHPFKQPVNVMTDRHGGACLGTFVDPMRFSGRRPNRLHEP